MDELIQIVFHCQRNSILDHDEDRIDDMLFLNFCDKICLHSRLNNSIKVVEI